VRVPVIFITALLAVLLTTGTGTALAAPLVTEFHDLSDGNGAWGVAAGPNGNVWFTEEKLDSVAEVTPQGEVTEYPLGSATCPKGITLGPDGNLWVAASGGGGAIARVTPSGEVTTFTDSLGLGQPWDITAGPDGNLWFVVKTPAAIGRITPDGVITLFTDGLSDGSVPTAITAGPDGNLWFADSAGRIGRVTTAGEITEFSEGLTAGMTPSDITAGPDGKLWFTMGGWPGGLGSIEPSGEIREYTHTLTESMEPSGIAAGNDGALWFTMAADPGAIGRMTVSGKLTRHTDGLTANQHPWSIASGPDGNMWFTENMDSGHIARVTVPAGVGGVEAYGIGKTVAQLTGYVLGNSQTTDYQFVYGPEGGEETTSPLYAAGRSPDPFKVGLKLRDLRPGTTYKFHLIATNDAGSSSASGRFTTQAEPVVPDAPKFEVPGLAPDFSRSVVAQPQGDVLFKAPGGRWHTLAGDDELPVGVTIDARRGSVTLTSEGDQADLQSGTFGGGLFAIKQPRRARGRVDLHLRGGNFKSCPRPRANRRKGGRRAGASAARRVRKLWGRDRGGRFRTHGRHSHATVRGTRWLTEDRCRGTFTKVTEGSVLVRDLVKRKSVLLRAGRSYLARPRR